VRALEINLCSEEKIFKPLARIRDLRECVGMNQKLFFAESYPEILIVA
jgi:hypothetical protein